MLKVKLDKEGVFLQAEKLFLYGSVRCEKEERHGYFFTGKTQ